MNAEIEKNKKDLSIHRSTAGNLFLTNTDIKISNSVVRYIKNNNLCLKSLTRKISLPSLALCQLPDGREEGSPMIVIIATKNPASTEKTVTIIFLASLFPCMNGWNKYAPSPLNNTEAMAYFILYISALYFMLQKIRGLLVGYNNLQSYRMHHWHQENFRKF